MGEAKAQTLDFRGASSLGGHHRAGPLSQEQGRGEAGLLEGSRGPSSAVQGNSGKNIPEEGKVSCTLEPCVWIQILTLLPRSCVTLSY